MTHEEFIKQIEAEIPKIKAEVNKYTEPYNHSKYMNSGHVLDGAKRFLEWVRQTGLTKVAKPMLYDVLSDDHIGVIARKVALRYAHVDEYSYDMYVKAIIEGMKIGRSVVSKNIA